MIVVVQEDVVFYRMQVIEKMFIYIAIVEAVLLVSYLLWTLLTLNNVLRSKEESEKKRYVDTLTGIYNRNKFIQIVEEYQNMGLKGMGIIFLDLNNLKHINDQEGHDAGDTLIKNAACIISKFFGNSVYRIGGDEFVVCVANLPEETFLKRANRLNDELEKKGINISMGITWRESSETVNEQIHEADQQMYRNKRKYYKENPRKIIE